jgi:hypothetical protein
VCGRQAVDEDVLAVAGSISLSTDEFMPLLVENRIPSIGNNPATPADFLSDASFPITGGADGIPRIFNPCESALELVVDGDQIDGETVLDFQNPFTGEECEFGPARLP